MGDLPFELEKVTHFVVQCYNCVDTHGAEPHVWPEEACWLCKGNRKLRVTIEQMRQLLGMPAMETMEAEEIK
jgi:hypothetical protein